jgi:hypothetical protein
MSPYEVKYLDSYGAKMNILFALAYFSTAMAAVHYDALTFDSYLPFLVCFCQSICRDTAICSCIFKLHWYYVQLLILMTQLHRFVIKDHRFAILPQ